MAYKNAQPKIADTLSVFIEQIEVIEKSTNSLKKISEGLNEKMNLFYQYEPKLNFAPLEKINGEYIRLIENKNAQVNAALNSHIDKIENERKQKDTFFFYFSLAIVIMFLISVFCTYLAFSNHLRKQDAQELLKKSEVLRQKNSKQFYDYLIETRQKDKYVNWLNK